MINMVSAGRTNVKSRPQSVPAGHAHELGEIISNPFTTCNSSPIGVTVETFIPSAAKAVANERGCAFEAISSMLAGRLGEGRGRSEGPGRSKGGYDEMDDDDQSSLFLKQRQAAARAAAQKLGCRDLRAGDRPRSSALTKRSKSLLNSANLRGLASREDPPARLRHQFNHTNVTNSIEACDREALRAYWFHGLDSGLTSLESGSIVQDGASVPEQDEDSCFLDEDNRVSAQREEEEDGVPNRTMEGGCDPNRSAKDRQSEDTTQAERDAFRRIIRQIRLSKVQLLDHLTQQKKSIKLTVDLLTDEGWSPEERYHRLVALGEKSPWPLTLKRSMCPTSIDMAEQGIGDELGCLLAETLPDYPILESLNVTGCQLTDKALIPLLYAVMNLPRLETLNLSGNEIDESSDVLRKYLEAPHCRLRRLGLCSADVDDSECGLIMESMRINKSVTSLDLGRNLIGESNADELMVTRGGPIRSNGTTSPLTFAGKTGTSPGGARIGSPMYDTYATANVASTAYLSFRLIGAKAVAETMRLNGTLTELDLSNNFLREASATTIALAMKCNTGITRLDLSHNAFKDEPAQKLAEALRFNQSLSKLNLSFNNLSPQAAFVLASTLSFHNKSMREMQLNGNLIGRRAIRAIYRAVRICGEDNRPLLVEMLDCYTEQEAEDMSVLDIYDPQGQYLLDLTKPYDFAVANQLLWAANTIPGAIFAHLAFVTDDLFSNMREDVVVLKKRVTRSPSTQYDTRLAAERLIRIHKQRGILYPEELGAFMKRLGLQPTRDTVWRIVKLIPDVDVTEVKLLRAIFVGVFREVDLDGSGFIDLSEFVQAMKLLGLELNEEIAKTHIVEYDIDRSGSIEEPEFIMYMMERFSYKVLDFQKTTLVSSSGQPWTVPSNGTLRVEFINQLLPSTFSQLSTEYAVQQLLENVKISSRSEVDRLELFDHVLLYSDIYFNSSQVLFLKNNLDLGLDVVGTFATILPQVTNYKAALEITEPFLNLRQRFQLRKLMGNAYRPVMGIPTGHYVMDLRNKWDRIALRRLAELDNKARLDNLSRKRALDTSQRGNGTGFRNETMDGQPFEITSHWIVRELPARGILRFDFVCMLRPQVDIPPLTMRRFRQLMSKLGLRMAEADMMAVTSLNAVASLTQSITGSLGGTVNFVNDFSGGGEGRNHLKLTGGATVTSNSRKPDPVDEDAAFKELLYEEPMQSLNDVLGPFSTVLHSYRELKMTSKSAWTQRARRQQSNAPLYEVPIDEAVSTQSINPTYANSPSVSGPNTTYFKPTLGTFTSTSQPGLTSLGSGSRPLTSYGSTMAPGSTSFGATMAPGLTFGSTVAQADYGSRAMGGANDIPITEKLTYVRSAIKLAELELVIPAVWLTCDQVLSILKNFSPDDSIRLSALLICYSKILDMPNFHKVMAMLDSSERDEVTHRLGFLNVCDGVHPDMMYNLDLNVYEDRKICEMIVLLAVLEGQSVWHELRFRESRMYDWDYYWTFPAAWVDDICRSKKRQYANSLGDGLGETAQPIMDLTGMSTTMSPTSRTRTFTFDRPISGFMMVKVRSQMDFSATMDPTTGSFTGPMQTKDKFFITSPFTRMVKSADADATTRRPSTSSLVQGIAPRRSLLDVAAPPGGAKGVRRPSSASDTESGRRLSAIPVHDLSENISLRSSSIQPVGEVDTYRGASRGHQKAEYSYKEAEVFGTGFDAIHSNRGGFGVRQLVSLISSYTLASICRDTETQLAMENSLTRCLSGLKTLANRQDAALLATMSEQKPTEGGLFNVSRRFRKGATIKGVGADMDLTSRRAVRGAATRESRTGNFKASASPMGMEDGMLISGMRGNVTRKTLKFAS